MTLIDQARKYQKTSIKEMQQEDAEFQEIVNKLQSSQQTRRLDTGEPRQEEESQKEIKEE